MFLTGMYPCIRHPSLFRFPACHGGRMSGSDIIIADISGGGGGRAAARRGGRGGRPGGNAHDHLPARPLQRLDN